MKEFLRDAAVIAVAALIGGFVVVGFSHSSQTGGDFAGGVTPSTVVTCSASAGFCNPVGSFGFETSNGLWLGGNSQYNEQSEYVTASGTPASVITLGPLGATTSTATSSVTLPNTAGLAIGAICSGGAATTTVYVSGCQLNSTNGVTGTAIVAYSNLTGVALAVPTSTIFRVTFDQLPY
jgi:hypothetical protein